MSKVLLLFKALECLCKWATACCHMPCQQRCSKNAPDTFVHLRSRWSRHAVLGVEIPLFFLGMHERRDTTQTRNLRQRRRRRLCELNDRLVGFCWTQSFQVFQVRSFSSGLSLLLQVSCLQLLRKLQKTGLLLVGQGTSNKTTTFFARYLSV